MNLHKVLATKNYCYTDLPDMSKVLGIMVHSTGCNNPNLRRYVAPDDGLLGTPSSVHWNQRVINGKVNKIGVHAFIGKLKDGTIATYQVQEWNHKCYHAGTGKSGKSANSNYISFEICEDSTNNEDYFNKVYQEAVELCAHLCKLFKLDPLKNIICHSEGHAMGFASNHADVMHWFKKYKKSMDTFRLDVKEEMEDNEMTQEKFNAMMDKYLEDRANMAGATSQEFKDAHLNATSKGIIKGDVNGREMWKSWVTREQLVLILKRSGLI